jgi:hypothetical protein
MNEVLKVAFSYPQIEVIHKLPETNTHADHARVNNLAANHLPNYRAYEAEEVGKNHGSAGAIATNSVQGTSKF